MKKIVLTLVLLTLVGNLADLYASEKGKLYLGPGLMFGGRYDNLRMCVATAAGKKGGPAADIQFNIKYHFSESMALSFALPVLRPILFGALFKMLQFEPQFTLEFGFPIEEDVLLILGPGLGGSVHYGPDYNSDLNNRGDDFWAGGPMVSLLLGISYDGIGKKDTVGVRGYYIPLISQDRSLGTVIGVALEYVFYF
ncbi:MAG: hypothetical protein GY754_02175 [bacterium]|nr:hypothetical protein [bacterium]